MKMTNEQAIQQMQDIIACWEEFLRIPENKDLQGTGLELEAMRMSVQALEEKPRWIPCAERLPDQDGLACEDGVTAWMPMPAPY